MRTELISKSQQIEFDSPPKFSLVERRMIFEIPDGFKLYLKKLESPTSIVGFILQYGYFKSSGKFFYVNVFNSEDIAAICRWNEIDKNMIDWKNYHRSTLHNQQKIIRTYFGVRPFLENEKVMVFSEATRLLKKQKRPNNICFPL
ncbi:DUF4158 domain-containing protein [Chryseobacterium nematophagum]|uniref:DUF4158 domain-containing protein n=1 Tax=Chryseobacterium nematophagum TaxID=2305228 RepID=A0A3M7TB40_9FLAO|nr:DUF4158 domain-containing protein [Chryseobacterium nematophagum]RNA60455.1 DUF4158 domain-containing protein [Chryseobacterium nematophagum]